MKGTWAEESKIFTFGIGFLALRRVKSIWEGGLML